MKPISEFESYFESQKRFDNLYSNTLRRFGKNFVDFSYANSYDGPDKRVISALENAIQEDRSLSFQYTPYGGRTITRRLIASRLCHEYDLPFKFSDVILTPGAMAALNVVFRTLLGPEDELIVLRPCWLDYPLYLQNLGIRFRFVRLSENKHFNIAAIRESLNPKTKGIIFSHPGCPTGVLYSQEEITELVTLLAQAEQKFDTEIFLISDEVHRHIIWGEKRFHSPLSSYHRGLSIYSFGKALFLQGQRIGYIAVSPEMPEREQLNKQLERCTQIMGFCTPTNLMQRAVCELLDYQPPLATIAKRQKEVRLALKEFGYDVCDADATFFVYAKAPIADDFRFAELLANYGVLVLPSTLFHEKGYFRISLTARSGAIASGLPAFAKVLSRLEEL